MSDIPIGRPPAPPGRHAAPAGWYPDPVDTARARYWDGWQWSREVREATPATPVPAPVAYAGAQPGRKAQTTADGVPLASWWARFGAWLIDLVLIQVIAMVITIGMWQRMLDKFAAYFNESYAAAEAGAPMPAQPPVEQMFPAADQFWFAVVMVVVAVGLHVIFLAWRSATPGQLLVGIRPVAADHGRDPGRLSANGIVLRALARGVLPQMAILWPFVIADGLVAAFDSRRQSVHDKISRTQVIKTR